MPILREMAFNNTETEKEGKEMTEDEARTKWCPMARVTVKEMPANRITERYNCIASDCMMWKVEISQYDANEINRKSNARQKATGYCGLAK